MPGSRLNDKSIFNAAREIGSEDARLAYLHEACGSDGEQFERVTALLAGFGKNSRFLESPASGLLRTGDVPTAHSLTSPKLERPGAQIGLYIVREQLGEGGMGVVYVAEQQEPVRRHVALKIIKPGMDSREILARFDAERQALAMMSHPNIAKILDGGATEAGRPFFVMELVKGVAITKFCDQQKLNLRERLELFVTVCQAVQHAHLKGIIHRDLKPSNILVELHDVTAMPKVIDFGVAKATHQRLTHQTIYTRFSQMIGTPQYMSPEQAQQSGLDIDTRSDVYSLGVVMYELLTGSTPFQESLATAGYDEMRRIIQEEEPPRPSHRISTLKAEQGSTLVERPPTAAPQLERQVERELDWIVLKALEKDRERRYESASALAQDIRRYLNDEPVEAFPPSATYRLRKFASRNTPTIVTTVLVAASLVIGTTVSIWQAREANSARELADQRFFEADNQRQIAVYAAQLAQQNEEYSQQLVYAADIKLAANAWQTGDVSRFTNLLDRYAQVADKTDHRGFEWSYLRQFGRANFRSIASQTVGSSVIRFSPDGKYLVTGRHDGSLCFWDGQSDEHLATRRGHEGMARGIDFAPDGNRMASIGDDGMIRLWDLAGHSQIRSFHAHADHGYFVCFVMDGRVLASSGEDSVVRLWDATTGESLGNLEGDAKAVELEVMSCSPDGRLCVFGELDSVAYMWDGQTNKRICRLDLGHRDGVGCWARCACFSPDGQLVAVGTNQNAIRLCNAQTGEQIETFTGHEDDIQAVTFHPSGRLLASSDMAGVIRTWPLSSAVALVEHDSSPTDQWPPYFQAHSARAWSIDFSPDGTRLVSASKDGNVCSWGGREQVRQNLVGAADASSVAFVSHGSELLIAGEKNIQIWNRKSDELRSFGQDFAKGEGAFGVAISPDGDTYVTGHDAGVICFWSRETGELLRRLIGHEDDVDHISFSPDGLLLATGSWDGTAKLWNFATGEQVAVFEMPPHCDDVAVSPNGGLLACSALDEAMLFDVTSGKRLHRLRGHKNSANCLAFSPDGKLLATGSADRTIRIWSVDTGKILHVISAHKDKIYSLAFSPDGRTIASGGGEGTIAFSHVATGQFLFDTKVGQRKVRWLHFSPDGTTLAAVVSLEGVVLLHVQRADSN
ncbi:serine/threonine-protein kinase [Aureliella helgolandensis]|uniref:Serine/threonine-protein kinase PknB n=1 Tax=Aureliella helgolandensis TaxID=2527968 RepID=A0A518GDW2_9BACT|nr:serine/threonine-protein kinase [Aureliella helgolandensis]QDV26786.1 Serine/threonine-protein kinase PknB [Aureliella helgolandensis]